MLSDQITCMANQYDEQSKDPVIDDARKTDQPGYQDTLQNSLQECVKLIS